MRKNNFCRTLYFNLSKLVQPKSKFSFCPKALLLNNLNKAGDVILCDNKPKNVAIATARLFNEVSVQKNELKRLGFMMCVSQIGLNWIKMNNWAINIVILILFPKSKSRKYLFLHLNFNKSKKNTETKKGSKCFPFLFLYFFLIYLSTFLLEE